MQPLIFTSLQIIQKTRECDKVASLCFLDKEKVFACVVWNELWYRKAEEKLVIAIHSF